MVQRPSLISRRFGSSTICVLVLSAGLFAQTGKPDTVAGKKETTETIATTPSKAEIAASQKLLHRAMRLSNNEVTIPEAFGLLEESSALNPTDTATATAREFVREELVSEHIARGNTYMNGAQPVEALAEFRQALALDPANDFATQRVRDAAALASSKMFPPPVLDYASEPVLAPQPEKHDFAFRGNSKDMLTNVGRSFGIQVAFDNSFATGPATFNVQSVDFYTAMTIACEVAKCFYMPSSSHEIVIAENTQEVRRNLQRLSLRTFYVPADNGAQAMPELIQILRSMLDLRFLTSDVSQSTITIRAPTETLDAAGYIIDSYSGTRPQVLLEIRLMRLDQAAAHDIGITYPLQFTLFNLNSAAQALGPSAQQLIASFLAGTLTPAQLVAAQALLAGGALQNSPLLKGFATFGGGIFKSGVVIPPGTLSLSTNHSLFTNLEHVTLRASQGQAATFHVGDRFPVITGTFNSVLSGLPGVPSQGAGFRPIVPAFTYEDLGVTLKATPTVSASSDVTMQLEFSIKELGAVVFNSIPTISNRAYTGTITVHDGETSVMAGSMDKIDTKARSGVPWLSNLPLLGRAFSNSTVNSRSDEMLLLITPHILQLPRPFSKSELYLSSGN